MKNIKKDKNVVTVILTDEQYEMISKDAKANERSIGAEIRYQIFGKGDDEE